MFFRLKQETITSSIMKLLTSVLVFFSFFNVYAQYSIQGKVIDESQKSIEFVTCFLQKDSTLIESVLTDSLGSFNFTSVGEGDYILLFRYFNNEILNHIHIEKDTSLIFKFELSKALDEVVLSYKRPLIVKLVDRVVFNVENSISSSGSSVYDLLKKTPCVQVSHSSISISGKSSVSVYLDDKIIAVTGDELILYLQSLSSDDIAKIEVITNPPSRYSAQGNCGIINIVQKQIRKKGYKGAVYSALSKNTFLSPSAGASFAINKKKISLNLKLNSAQQKFLWTNRSNIEYPQNNWDTKGLTNVNYMSLKSDVSLDYRMSKKQTIGISYHGNTNRTQDLGQNSTSIIQNHLKDSLIQTNFNSDLYFTLQNSNFYINRNLDTNGKTISFNIDWYKTTKNESRELLTNHFASNGDLIGNSQINFLTAGDRVNSAYTFSLDFVLPYKYVELTAGLKSNYMSNFNHFNFSNKIQNSIILDTINSNEFNYFENIEAAYLDVFKELGTWSFKAGIRSEYTNAKGVEVITNQKNTYTYLNFFPTAFIQKEISENANLALSYSKRINRPAYSSLNPFRFYSSPYTYFVGNTFLRPEFTNNLEFSYSFQDFFMASLSYSKRSNGIGDVSFIDSTSFMNTSTEKNFLTGNQLVINVVYVFNKFSRWESYNDFYYAFSDVKSNLNYTLPGLKGGGAEFASNNQFLLNKRKTFASELNFSYTFPSVDGLTKGHQFYCLDIGFRYLFLNKNLKVALNFTDLFKSDLPILSNRSNSMKIISSDYYDNRSVRFSINYTFGNDKVTEINKEETNSEVKERGG